LGLVVLLLDALRPSVISRACGNVFPRVPQSLVASTLELGDTMLNKKSLVAATVAALMPAVSAFAQGQGGTPARESTDPLDLVVITATRANEGVRADFLGSSFTILQPEDLQQRQTRYLSDILRDVPGVSVSRSGSLGGVTQLRLRGTEANHTLVMIDGMEASDPYYGEFDFATLITDEVARVEVLRGQQSALYGSDAIGGVINYITLNGRDAPGGRVRMEGGSFGTKDVSARYAGVAGAFDYALSAGYTDTDGFPVSRGGSRDLGSENGVVSSRFEYTPTETFRLKAIARYSRTEGDTNDQDYSFPPGPTFGFVIDSDDYYKNHAFYGLVRGELDTFEGRWTHALSAQGVDASRDSFSGGAFDYGDNGKRMRYSYESTVRFGSETFAQTLTGAFDHERENFQNLGPFLSPEQSFDRQITNKGAVLQYDARINERIGLGAAIRHDDNDRFDNDTTYRVQASFRFDRGTRLRAAAGTGIKNPGIFELFGFDPGTFIGNPDVKPEKSRGWEIGVDQSFADGAAFVGATYFDSKLKDEIFTTFLPNFDSTVLNRDTGSTQKGVELFAQARLAQAWRIDASYTYLDSEENGVEEVRRAPHIASVNVAWRAPEDRAGVALTVRYNGSTNDNNFTLVSPEPFIRLPSYTLVNLGADYRFTDNVQIYGRVENLLDESYEEVHTYRSAGLGAYAGARLTF
jgi:vitamin B12 transporter